MLQKIDVQTAYCGVLQYFLADKHPLRNDIFSAALSAIQRHPTHSSVQESAIVALSKFFNKKSGALLVISVGAIPSMIESMQKFPHSWELQAAGCWTVHCMCRWQETRFAVSPEQSALLASRALKSHTGNWAARSCAMKALEILLKHGDIGTLANTFVNEKDVPAIFNSMGFASYTRQSPKWPMRCWAVLQRLVSETGDVIHHTGEQLRTIIHAMQWHPRHQKLQRFCCKFWEC